MNDAAKRKRVLFLGLSVFGLLSVTLIVYGIFFYTDTNPYGDQLEIQNLSSYTDNKPTNEDREYFIKHQLFLTVNMNTKNTVANNSIKDIVVRDGTFAQTKEGGLHTVIFIVDSEQLQQSYRVSYQWSDDSSVSVHQWGTTVQCLAQEDMIYADFNCKDPFSELLANIDPTLDAALPYKNPFYSITYFRENSVSTISVKIMSNNNSDRTRKFFQEYKKESISWLKSQAINLDDYVIIFRDFSGDIVETIPKKSTS